MSGIYVHIPFCKQACVYCDFHFSTLNNNRDAMVKAIVEEAKLRQEYLDVSKIDTLYFGGGTPSILSVESINWLIEELSKIFDLQSNVEITLEANPDDLSPEYLEELSQSRINRLSIGVQSFKEEDLRFMNRAHSAEESLRSIELLPHFGFDNYTIDLIYGLPNQSLEDWQWQLAFLEKYKVPHFSAYALTVEEKTVLHHQIEKGEVSLKEELALDHFKALQDFAIDSGFNHYELSNFCRPGFKSKHNTAYWESKSYLGLGPSAHSFNGKSRSWNISNNTLYLKGLANDTSFAKTESLNDRDFYNELVMTRLRLESGLGLEALKELSGDLYYEYCLAEAEPEIKKGRLIIEKDHLFIPVQYRFQSDGIAASLFKV
jgi:oxygen-independent coproporphyrinogen-3 oxidase